MRPVLPWLSIAVLLIGAEASRAGIEELAPQTAHAEIQQSRGVVLVDLFAEW
jgi:hypothetical protein